MASKFFRAFNFFKGKVSPTIKSVKPTTDIKGSVKRAYSDRYTKNIRDLGKAEDKIRTGKEMMKEGQKARKQMIGTGRAFQFRSRKSTHAVDPQDNYKVKYKDTIAKDKPQKKFKKGKELEKKADGGRIGYKTGMSVKGDNKRDIRKTESMIGASKSSKREKGLVGNQKKIDVAAPFGTINAKDFEKLRRKKT